MSEKRGGKKTSNTSKSSDRGKSDPHGAAWNRRLEQLKAFKEKHGHCNVPADYSRNPRLGHWVANQRQERKRGMSKPERVRQLDAIGFQWELRNRSVWRHDWDTMVAALVDFKDRFGHCNVPNKWSENPSLGAWLRSARVRKRTGELSAKRVQQLNRLGVMWEPMRQHWDERYADLVKFKKQNGHCSVHDGWPESPQLAGWLVAQRARYRRNKLPREEFKKLDKLGVVWTWGGEEQWERMYAQLIEYQRVHGRCHVSTLSPDHGPLANWIRTQRTKRKKGELSRKHMRKLNEIGFVWDVIEAQWEEMYAALSDYRETYGHCHVPSGWPSNTQLANWVQTQRAYYRQNRLPQSKIRRLRALGFLWDGKKARDELVAADALPTA